jgi:hypothetical protein
MALELAKLGRPQKGSGQQPRNAQPWSKNEIRKHYEQSR